MRRMTRRAFLASLGVSASLGHPSPFRRWRGSETLSLPLAFGSDLGREPVPQVTPLSPPFRLSESWYRQTVKRLQDRLAERGLDGIILKDRWNIIYVSGLFHTTTERPFWLFVPTRGEPIFFYPGLDKDLVNTWWIKEGEWYFDYPHAGPFNTLAYKAGPKADLLQWMLKGLARRGFGRARLGIEEEVGPTTMKRMQDALPEARFEVAGDLLLRMRMIKTPEEIELTRKAIALHDRMLAFARDYILQRGTDATDFEVRHRTEEFATHELMKLMQPTGRPHQAVGVSLRFGCRAGVATAYPHPNQFFYARIRRGDAVQIAAVITIGGYGGEGYRALHIEPMTDHHRKLWDVHTEMVLKQQELSKAGVRCQEVAEKVLEIAVRARLERYVYHRPAHGQGMEGHQAPYIAPGDDTILEEGMMFSNEPGLYDPENGFGYNHSNCVLVTRERGVALNQTPLTREWCWLKL
jgi:Xaa-Pro dipeptidase